MLGVLTVALSCGYQGLFQKTPEVEIAREITGAMGMSGELKLLFTGDTGTGDIDQKNVAAAMEKICLKNQIDGVVLLGDNFYFDGVKSVNDPQWQTKFEKIYNAPCLATKKFYVVLGNHDVRQSVNAQVLYTDKSSRRWNLPNRFYVVSFAGVADFFAIDSNFPDVCGVSSLCSLDWMGKKMGESNTPWKIVIGHHPLLSGGKYPKPKWFAGLAIPNLLCKGGADFYFAAHDHNMQHLKGLSPGGLCNVNQLVLGGGGAPLNPVSAVPGKTLFAAQNHGFAYARLDATSIAVSFYTPSQDSPIYEFSQKKTVTK